MKKNVLNYDARWKGISIHCFSDSIFSRGVSILFNKDLNFKILNIHKSNEGRKLMVNIAYDEKIITLVNLYAPNDINYRCDFFKRAKEWISKYTANFDNLLICGDLNCSTENESDKSVIILKQLLNKLDLHDMWKTMKSGKKGYSWCNGVNIPTSRIDYILLSDTFCFQCENIRLQNIPGSHSNGTRMSDHKCLIFSLIVNENLRGPGYWKFNTSLIENETFMNEMNTFLKNYNFDKENALDSWENLKRNIKTKCINLSKNISKSYKNKINSIQGEISKIEDLPYEKIDMNRKRKLENELTELINKKAKGAQVRSRAKWIEEGERNTSYFLNLEKRRQISNVIKSLKNEKGTVFDEDEILDSTCNFYEKLYTSNNENDNKVNEYLSNIQLEYSLNDEEKNELDTLPSLSECTETVFIMKKNKSPGSDGLPCEFYQTFWENIKQHYYCTLQEIFQKYTMTYSQRLSLITLLFKKGDPQSLNNYRPISLTNTDYKIIAFLLANRLQKVLDKAIHVNQSAYIKGRNIALNARLIIDIFEYCEENDIESIMLFLDFQKAFDSVEWNFMTKVLKKFNFGENFLKWVNILYNKPIFKIKNNGWMSKTCNMQRGIRQGCPISAILFLFVIEILAVNIRSNSNINGFQKPGMTNSIKIIQHADDCTLPLKDETSLEHSLKVIAKFSNVSGMYLNMSKTECILTGPHKYHYKQIRNVNVNNDSIKTLGIYIGHNKEICYKNNWTKIVDDLEKLFESWKKRKLTIFGKVCVINSLAISKIIYVGSVLSFPNEEVIKKFQSLLYNYIWNKRDRIKRNTQIGNVLKGGIGIVDVSLKLKSIKVSWINRISSERNSLFFFVDSLCKERDFDFEYLCKTNITKSNDYQIMEHFPLFYKEMLVFFNECKKNKKQFYLNALLKEPLWCNKNFMYKNKPIFFHNWLRSGFKFLNDIVNENGIKPLEWFDDKLICKKNWMCEYMIIKTVITKTFKSYEYSNIRYENIFHGSTSYDLLCKGHVKVCDINSKLIYEILCHEKFIPPLHQTYYGKVFEITKTAWKSIYEQKILSIRDRSISEFNYKLLNNLLCNRELLKKWKIVENDFCVFCRDAKENNEHLILKCKNVSHIWDIVKQILKFDISWKTIVIGFYYENNEKTLFLNSIISLIACKIYKYKMYCRLDNKDEKPQEICNHIKSKLNFYTEVYTKIQDKKYAKVMKAIKDKL